MQSPFGILKNLCPRCGKGKVFRGLYRMNKRCPECDLDFEPENGYFLGAMIISYAVTAFSLVPTAVLLVFGLHAPLPLLFIVPIVQLLLLNPPVFHVSRLAWIYVDRKWEQRR